MICLNQSDSNLNAAQFSVNGALESRTAGEDAAYVGYLVRSIFPKDIFVENVFDAILTNLAVDHPQAPLSEPLDITMFFWSSFAVLPVQRLCAHVHRQGAHPHWSMRQHVSVRQEEVSACAQRVWLHMARGGFNTFITN